MNKIKHTVIRHAFVAAGLVLSSGAYAIDCSSFDVWAPDKAYNGGKQVQHLGDAYSANWWTRNNNPTDFSGPYQEWTNDGQCQSTGPIPQVSITAPINGALLAENDNVVLSANASITAGSIAQVSFLVDGTVVATDTSAPYTTNWTATPGEHNIVVSAVASSGAIGQTSISVSVTGDTANLPPTVSLTNPTASTQVTVGDVLTLQADASDVDGQVDLVEFYVDDQQVGSDSTAPFSYDWSAVAGTHSFKAIATDDDLSNTVSASVSLAVQGGSSGGCAGIPQYVAGTTYAAGDEVQNLNQKYRCDIGGWCSSSSTWAYAPGTGDYWSDAWSDLGICAIGPEVTFTAPSDNAIVLAGSTVDVTVDAIDSDGSVSQVEFFAAGASLGVDTSAPYAAQYVATGTGEVQLKAIATDNEGNAGQSTILVSVTDQALVTNLTSPTSGSSATVGKPVSLSATASSFADSVSQVEFMVNGAVVATDTSAPYTGSWTPSSAGQYSLSAKATDSQGATAQSAGASVSVYEPPVGETHKLIGYWHNFINASGCPLRLGDISEKWDVVDIAFADNDRNSNGTVHFNLFAGKNGCPAIDPAQFKQDIAALRAQGKPVVLSLGGAEGTITLNTDADEVNFVSSLTDIVNEWGFSGLDIDLESGSNLVHGSQIQQRLPRALKAIEANTGGDMYLTMAPEHPYVHGGMIAYTGIWGAYIPLIDELRGTLDLLHVQLYNNSGLPNPYMANAAPEGSVDMMVASVKMLVEGFELADGSTFAPLRDDQVAIGLPSGPSSANSGQAPTQNIINALDCITDNISCSSIVPSAKFPNIGGVMTWSINWDVHDGFNFSGPIGDKIDAMNAKQ